MSVPTLTPCFRSKLWFEDDDGFPYALTAPLIYDSAVLNRTLTVPVGFATDLASIPRALWNLLPKSGRYDRAAVIHDFLYATGGVTRSEADSVLREAMDTLGVGGWTRWVIYTGVRVGGWKPWGAYRQKDVSHV